MSFPRPASLVLVFASLTLSGCISVPEEHTLMSNHRNHPVSTVMASCQQQYAEVGRDAHSPVGELDAKSIRLLNWNILKASRDNWSDDFNRFGKTSDLLLLQEAQLNNEFLSAISTQGHHWDLSTGFHYAGAPTGVLIASSVKPGRICALRSREPWTGVPKTALVAEYRIKGSVQSLLVANIHMINYTILTSEYKQQAAQLQQVLALHTGPVIMAGDFNTWSDDRKNIVASMASALQTQSVKFERDHRLSVFGNRVDHVYYRGLEIVASDTEIVDTSDHNPMMVTFRVVEKTP